jgi:hypothetical protein
LEEERRMRDHLYLLYLLAGRETGKLLQVLREVNFEEAVLSASLVFS